MVCDRTTSGCSLEFQHEYTSRNLSNLRPIGFQEVDSSVLDKSDDSLTRVYNALANPTGRRIGQILKERGKAGFNELLDALKISVGALYMQLDNLEGLVAQGADRKYVLTADGRTAIDALTTGADVMVSDGGQTPTMESRLSFYSRELLFRRSVFNFLSKDPLRSLPLSAIILAAGGVVSFVTNLEPILLFYLNPTQGIVKTWFLLLFPLGWFITFVLADVICNLFYHRRGGELGLVNGTVYAMLPLLLVPGLIIVFQPFSTLIRSTSILTILIQVIIQVWVVCLLSGAISVSKGLSLKRAILVSLAVMSLNVAGVVLALAIGVF